MEICWRVGNWELTVSQLTGVGMGPHCISGVINGGELVNRGGTSRCREDIVVI